MRKRIYKLYIRLCKRCNEFYKTEARTGQFCDDCNKKINREKWVRCPNCLKLFDKKTKNKKYCSLLCRWEYYKNNKLKT